ncbi:MAG: ATP-binding protein [Proteobacteria bacterium]|nr:ATP-binding protein [Pseudomonadota bacterium]MDA0914118.1 ATP-binding protein [Pseudomonadota bacterium]MDA1032999.1 ATP-binding protein [Pseudomonadota bacterium]
MDEIGAIIGEKPDKATQLEGLAFAAVLIDPEGRIAELNYAAEILLSRSEKMLLGKTVASNIDILDDRVLAHLNDPESPLVARNVGLRVNDQESRVNLTISPLASHPGWRIMTLSDTGRDDGSNEREAEVASSGAPSILAHEIRNPLAAIRGAAQLASRKLEPNDRGLAKVIMDEVDRIARLIDRMQQLGGSTREELASTNLHVAIRSALATVRAAGAEGVKITEEFDPSLPPVLANRDALEQVVMNLVSNACDALRASEQANPAVIVRTRFVSGFAFSAVHEGKAVKLPIEITVTDNGPGIDEALRDHVFEPFVTTKKSGQGLGLALVRKLVRDMHGCIAYARDTRLGLTHFRFHLALAVDGEQT